MLDFIKIKEKSKLLSKGNDKKGTFDKYERTIYPEFIVKKSNDLMTRGKSFYAIWDEDKGLWSTNEEDVQRLIDNEILDYAQNHKNPNIETKVSLLENFSSNQWMQFQKYCKNIPDNYHELDESITFSNTEIKKNDYVSRCLSYPFINGETECFDELINTLYDPDERQKLEWAIGSIIAGDSKKIQKFIVLYGGPNTGKSTIINIIMELFQGYYSSFESKVLGSANASFALEAFRSNPLIAIQHDGDLSRIEDNTRLNSIVSHEVMSMNEKFKQSYDMKFKSFIIMATNKPVKITDAKSGIIRRLIDVVPSGRLVPSSRYDYLMDQIKRFELSGIASKCYDLYKELGPTYYDKYIPINMIGATNNFFNFIEDNLDLFNIKDDEYISLSTAWLRYKEYCTDSNISYPYNRMVFKDELKNYFNEFYERYGQSRSVYKGFKKDKFEYKPLNTTDHTIEKMEDHDTWLKFEQTMSIFDDVFADCPAQKATEDHKPSIPWAKVKTTLKDLDTTDVHFVNIPEERKLITIDFDLKDNDGYKSFERNLKEASKWPRTYAEISKSGDGIHLHYWYSGDVSKLARIYDENIEILTCTGNTSLRRKLSKCNNLPITTINSGLPLRKGRKMEGIEVANNEGAIRRLIANNLLKKYHADTSSSINFIYQILEDAYNGGVKYDVRDMRPDVQQFALHSTNQAERCLKMVNKMKFCSEEATEKVYEKDDNKPIVFYDVEVYPNLFIVCWKKIGEGTTVVKMINPTGQEIEEFVKNKLVGFNNRKYDNHILYGRMIGYDNKRLYNLSQGIINNEKGVLFGEAYNLSYTDIYDYCSNINKMSLKKWEIKLGIHHVEMGIPWDQPVPEDKWEEVADYCCNDVLATEAVWNATQSDWLARKVLAKLSGLSVNDTTNSHTTRIIIGKDPNPQSQFIYTDLSEEFPGYEHSVFGIDKSKYNEGTKIVSGKSLYRGEDPGEGGYVYADPGIYFNVATLDVASMHPSSARKLMIFGPKYTPRYGDIVDARLYAKHKEYDKFGDMLDGKLKMFMDDKELLPELPNGLKTAINSVYGLTSATYPNKLKDPRNVDNIVAKRGALFMIDLKYAVQEKGYKVVHIKTDSIKIADADNNIIKFVMEFGKKYGYNFEHESTYERIALVNDSVYIARYASKSFCEKRYGYIPSKVVEHELEWTATGAQFAEPYIFKTLFTHEPIEFKDLCSTFQVGTALYLDMNEELGEDEHDYRFIGKVGLFTPVKPGCGGGILLRRTEVNSKNKGTQSNDEVNEEVLCPVWKYDAANNTKKRSGKGAYRWLESEMLDNNMDMVDYEYFRDQVDKAIETLSKFGDVEQFKSV